MVCVRPILMMSENSFTFAFRLRTFCSSCGNSLWLPRCLGGLIDSAGGPPCRLGQQKAAEQSLELRQLHVQRFERPVLAPCFGAALGVVPVSLSCQPCFIFLRICSLGGVDLGLVFPAKAKPT